MWKRFLVSMVLTFLIFSIQSYGRAEPEAKQPSLEHMRTKSGVSFGVWGIKPYSSAPTLIILGGTIKATLDDEYGRQCGNTLAGDGYLCVSIDLPCHGLQHRVSEPQELDGWAFRAANHDDFVIDNNNRLTEVLDYLIEKGFSDPNRIAACGTSRGGFLALHFAAHDPRVRCVAAFAPVTDLRSLREFSGTEANSLVQSMNLATNTDGLAGHSVWIVIGDQDERVGTDNAIACARNITAASLEKELLSRVELHVLPEPKGHTTPHGASSQAAKWIRSQMK